MYQNIPTKCLTGECRLSYVHLTQPYASPSTPGAKAKYQVTLLIPKTDVATKADIDAAIQAAYQQGVASKWNGLQPRLASPLIHDGDGGSKIRKIYAGVNPLAQTPRKNEGGPLQKCGGSPRKNAGDIKKESKKEDQNPPKAPKGAARRSSSTPTWNRSAEGHPHPATSRGWSRRHPHPRRTSHSTQRRRPLRRLSIQHRHRRRRPG